MRLSTLSDPYSTINAGDEEALTSTTYTPTEIPRQMYAHPHSDPPRQVYITLSTFRILVEDLIG